MKLNVRTRSALAIAGALAVLSACVPPGTTPNPTGTASPTAAPGTSPTPGASPAAGARVEAEPNDEFASAQQLDLATTLTGDIGGDDERDFYAFSTPAGVAGTLRVTLTETSADYTPFITFFTSARTEFEGQGAPDGTTSPFVREVALSGGQSYFLRLDGGGERAPYQLRAEWVPVNDTFEPNNDSGTAKLLDSGSPVDLTLFGGTEPGVDSDVDYFKIPVPAGATKVRVEIDNRSQTADAQTHLVELLGPSGEQVGTAGAPNAGANLDHTFEVEGAGEYVLRFDASGVNSTLASQLLVTVE